MIKYFMVENFRSIMKENILEFDTGITRQNSLNINPVIGFVGANASGKTTILEAISFVLWFMKDSYLNINDSIPFSPFVINSDLPSKFHIIFSKQSTTDDQYKYIDYEYELILTTNKVIYESLHYYTDNHKNMVYIRNDDNVTFGSNISIPANDITIFKKDLKYNSSIISYAAMYPSQEIAIACKNYNFTSNVGLSKLDKFEFNEFFVHDLLKNKVLFDRVLEYIKVADIGIDDIILTDDLLDKNESEEIKQTVHEMNPDEIFTLNNDFAKRVYEYKKKPSSLVIVKDVHFDHRIGGKKISFDKKMESSGTLKFLVLLSHILTNLDDGALLILDEIELHLHQDLICMLIDLYKTENTNNAQLIFSFHNPAIMKMLLPDELWFTEKTDNGDTAIFSASHFEDIQDVHDKDLEKLYRIGRFGAKPRGI